MVEGEGDKGKNSPPVLYPWGMLIVFASYNAVVQLYIDNNNTGNNQIYIRNCYQYWEESSWRGWVLLNK